MKQYAKSIEATNIQLFLENQFNLTFYFTFLHRYSSWYCSSMYCCIVLNLNAYAYSHIILCYFPAYFRSFHVVLNSPVEFIRPEHFRNPFSCSIWNLSHISMWHNSAIIHQCDCILKMEFNKQREFNNQRVSTETHF